MPGKNWKTYGAFDEKTKTFTFDENLRIITEGIAKSLPEGVENLVGNNVQAIEQDAFRKYTALKTVNFPNATTIENYAFLYCSSLTTVNIPNATIIGGYAFKDCSSLTTARFNAATNIGFGAFAGCTALEEVEFNAAEKIEGEAFAYCENLTTVNFPSVETIENNAFAGCKNLTTVNFPSVETIENNAFAGCKNLTTVNIPNATTIGRRTFDGCPVEERLKKEVAERKRKVAEIKRKKDYDQAFDTEAGNRKQRKDIRRRAAITHGTKRATRPTESALEFMSNQIFDMEENNNKATMTIKTAFKNVGKYFVTETASSKNLFSRKEMKHKIGKDVKKICPDWYDTLAISLKDNMLKQVKLSKELRQLYSDSTAGKKEKATKIRKAKSLAILLISLRGLCDKKGNCYAKSAIEGLKSGGFTLSLQSSDESCLSTAATILNNDSYIDTEITGQLSSTGTEIIKTIIDSSSVKLVSMPFNELAAKAEAEKMANSDFSTDLQKMFDEKKD